MKRFLIYIAIISIGTFAFNYSAQATASVHTQNTTEVAKIVSKPPNTVEKQQTNVQLTSDIQKASTQQTTVKPVAPVAPAPIVPASVPITDHDSLMAAAGISSSDYQYVDYIVSHESGWCPFKWEGEIGYCPSSYTNYYGPYSAEDTYKGYGECQSTPAIKMSVEGADWATNAVTQLKWCNSYAQSRYGGWYEAYNYWINNHHW